MCFLNIVSPRVHPFLFVWKSLIFVWIKEANFVSIYRSPNSFQRLYYENIALDMWTFLICIHALQCIENLCPLFDIRGLTLYLYWLFLEGQRLCVGECIPIIFNISQDIISFLLSDTRVWSQIRSFYTTTYCNWISNS